jgi:hypothetical protein
MQQGKNNIISEITRIHQIMGVNKQISEQVLLSTPVTVFKELASKLAKYAGTRRLDKTSRSLVTKLSKGTKKITNATGKIDEIPFDEDDYLNIFGKLRTSFDPGIRSIINAADNIILNFISTQTVPKTLNSPELLAKIQGDIQKGLNEDDVVDAMAIIFRNQIGVYADDVIDEFIDGVRKIYRDLTGKVPDDVVPPAPVKVVDDTGKVVDDVADESASGTDNIGEMLDGEKTPTPKEAEEVLEELADEENISREIANLSPLFNRYQNQTANEGVELANEAMSLIERRAALRSLQGVPLLNLERQIKDLMERIWKWDKTYVEALEAEIENNLKFKDSENFARWEKIRSDVDKIKKDFGRWGVREKSTNLSPTWILIKESLKSAFKLYVDIYKLAQSATGIVQFGKDTVNYIMNSYFRAKSGIDTQAKKVADDFESNAKANVSLISKYVIPGSPRGWPTRMKAEKEIDVANTYAAIQNSARSNQYAKAWLSLFLEKIFVIIRIQLEMSFLIGSYQFVKFLLSDNTIMQRFGPCVLETADKIKKGTIKLDVKEVDPINLPACLVELISSNKITEEELGQFMVRAEFFSRSGGSEVTGYYTPYLFNLGKETILRFFTGPLAGTLIKGIYEWYDEFIKYEKTGDDYALETGLRNYRQSLQQRLETIEEQADEEMENLTQSEQDSLVQVVDSIQNASGGSNFIINTDD